MRISAIIQSCCICTAEDMAKGLIEKHWVHHFLCMLKVSQSKHRKAWVLRVGLSFKYPGPEGQVTVRCFRFPRCNTCMFRVWGIGTTQIQLGAKQTTWLIWQKLCELPRPEQSLNCANTQRRYSLISSQKLAVLAEVALALARNRQAPGPLETLKLSS